MPEAIKENHIRIELYGPFRKFGKEFDLPLKNEATYSDMIDLIKSAFDAILGEEKGSLFKSLALSENSLLVFNRQLIPFEKYETLRIAPGDRVAFSCLE